MVSYKRSFIHAITFLRAYNGKATSAFVFQARRSVRQLSRTKHREVYYARIERVFKNARTLTSRHNGIFGDASLVMFADHRIERCACQVHTSAPLFEPP